MKNAENSFDIALRLSNLKISTPNKTQIETLVAHIKVDLANYEDANDLFPKFIYQKYKTGGDQQHSYTFLQI